DTKPAGIEAHGSTSGTATDEDGADVTVEFTRAAKLRVYVDAQVVLEPGTGGAWATDAADAVASRAYAVGDTAYASQLICALLEVPGIVAVTSLTLGTSSGPVGSSVAADYDEIVQIASADV